MVFDERPFIGKFWPVFVNVVQINAVNEFLLYLTSRCVPEAVLVKVAVDSVKFIALYWLEDGKGQDNVVNSFGVDGLHELHPGLQFTLP